jgi:site-specific recombinase XerD
MRDIDVAGRRCIVMGKGNKHRTIYFGRTTTKALSKYFAEQPREPDTPVFLADRGTRAEEALTPSGLFQLIRRLGRVAGIQAARCSPHTFRHTFALQFSQNGGNAFTLKELLGHTSLAMTNRYVALAQANMESQHRQFSPADRIKRGK